MKKLLRALPALITFLAAGANAQKVPRYPIEQYTLKNGLRVVLSPDHSVPVISLSIAYHVGSRNEVRGKTGFAHLFEHMMFQGSAHVGKAEHNKYIAGNGGTLNGTTNGERTNYFETLPAEKLPLALWLEADRMRSLAVTPENLHNQQEVVKEEKRLRYDNVPYAAARSRVSELLYGNFANQHTTIGSMADLDAASLADVQNFFKTYYAPNNAALALVGDFDTKTAKAIIAQYFEGIPRQADPPKTDITEPKQTEAKRDKVTDALARVPALYLAWHSPSLGEPDNYALDLLSEILFSGETSRAYQEIVKKRQLALSLGGGQEGWRGANSFDVFAVQNPQANIEDLEKAIYEQIAQVQQTPPTKEELQKVKTRILAQRLRLESTQERAIRIAEDVVLSNDANRINTDLARYLAVTPEQIQAAAKKYLVPANSAEVEVVPGAGSGRTAQTTAGETK